MKPVIMIAQRIGGENGGPFISHKRIMASRLKEKYDFIPLMVPRARFLLLPWNMLSFSQKIRKQKPQMVQIAGLQMEGFLTMIACKLAGVRTVLAIHGSLMEAETVRGVKRCIYSILELLTVKLADGVFGVSNYVSSWAICKKAKKYYGTIYNLISQDDLYSEIDLRKELNIHSDAVIIASTGRIIREKGYGDLWDIIQMMSISDEVHFLIAGDGNYLHEFREEVCKKGFEDRVHLLGYIENVEPVLNAADIFIMCTHHETFCISILEACEHHLPIVASDVGGIPEIVEHGVNGYLVPVGDTMGFVKSLSELISSKEIRQGMGLASYQKANSTFNADNILNKLDFIYSDLI